MTIRPELRGKNGEAMNRVFRLTIHGSSTNIIPKTLFDGKKHFQTTSDTVRSVIYRDVNEGRGFDEENRLHYVCDTLNRR